MDFRETLNERDLRVAPDLTTLRPQQDVGVAWGRRTAVPYLLINAPTGSGKTLLLGVLGTLLGRQWTYTTHTIRLQEQITRTFPDLPVVTGRANHPCLIGMETHRRSDVTAAEGICTMLEWCEYSGQPPSTERHEELAEAAHGRLCDYYAQRLRALSSPYRTANYALTLADYRTFVGSGLTDTLLCDEAHSIEEELCRAATIRIMPATYRSFHLFPPKSNDVAAWVDWAGRQLWATPKGVESRRASNIFRLTIRQQLEQLRAITNPEEWVLERDKYSVLIYPLWGRTVASRLLLGYGLERPPARAVFTSATLIGPEYYADRLGLPDGSWAYLELPHTFPAERRPINYSPVRGMSAEAIANVDSRRQMQTAIDNLIEWYLRRGARGGLIHAVSNNYRNYMLAESRFRGIMNSDPAEHERRIRSGERAVLVSANSLEGWDGVDDLVRFTIFPKVPYANLGDTLDRRRADLDPRSYDYAALIGVIQGAGRGVRSEEDYADTWILDSNWQRLFDRRKSWVPQWFRDAYHGPVALPKETQL